MWYFALCGMKEEKAYIPLLTPPLQLCSGTCKTTQTLEEHALQKSILQAMLLSVCSVLWMPKESQMHGAWEQRRGPAGGPQWGRGQIETKQTCHKSISLCANLKHCISILCVWGFAYTCMPVQYTIIKSVRTSYSAALDGLKIEAKNQKDKWLNWY